MSLDEGISRFIGRLYEAVYDERSWKAAMAELLQRTESRLAFISTVDVRGKEYSKSLLYGPEDSSICDGILEYTEELFHDDPSLIWAGEHPEAGLCETARIIDPSDYANHPFIIWNRSRLGSTHWRVFYTQPVDGVSFAVSLHPPASTGAPPERVLPLHRLLFEHMERALRLAARPPDLSATAEATIVLDNEGQVMTMSPHAESLLALADGLHVERRALKTRDPAATARLEGAIRSAIKSQSVGGAGGGVRLRRASGGPDWLALVSPCARYLDHLPVRTPAAIVRIVDAQTSAALLPRHAELFDLTPREQSVASAMLAGHSLESLCGMLQISRNTAKAHLQALFRKTGTNRQSELVHLLAEVARS